MTEMRILNCTNPENLPDFKLRAQTESENIDAVVAEVIDRVCKEGDRALFDYTAKFDGVKLNSLTVTDEEVDAAVMQVAHADPDFMEILCTARDNIAAYHQKQKRQGFIMDETPGVVMGQKIIPLKRVGIYVPGGTARYPSTVLMDAVPAQIAGVEEIVMVTPPAADGNVPPDTLVAAYVAGVHKIFKVGGAQAVAALSYGTESIPQVDKIVGPGNIYVATAKRMVYGQVDIDMIAGPSDILIVADDGANPVHLAADLLGQAEHDPLSSAVLITNCKPLAEQVQKEVARQLAALPRQDIAGQAIANGSAILLTDTLQTAVQISNKIAPEHLELCVREPFALLPLVQNAGSIFLGYYAPEVLGDYYAGPNHTLPTEGTARFSSPLSVDDFCKKSSFLYYDKEAFGAVAGKIATFAKREGLDGHANSALFRIKE